MFTPDHPARVLLIGFGLGGRIFHAPFITAEPGLQLAGILTGDPDRQAAARSEYPDAMVYGERDDAFAAKGTSRFDLAVVSTPPHTHVSFALDAILAGMDVVIDKPFAPRLEDVHEIRNHARLEQRMVIPFQNRRYDGDFRTVRHLLDEGALGDVFRFESRFERWRLDRNPDSWRDMALVGTGLLLDLGSHLIDQALVLFGPVVRVHAIAQQVREGAESDDHTLVLLEHRSGTVSEISVSLAAASIGPRFRVLGSKTSYVCEGLDVQEASLRAGERPTSSEPWGVYPPERWGLLGTPGDVNVYPSLPGDPRPFWHGVVQAMNGAAPPPVTLDEIVELHTVLDAAREASDRHTVVTLPNSHGGTVRR